MAKKLTFKGGVHPLRHIHHGKYLTEECAIQRCSVPDEVVIPLSQHIGTPSKPIVSTGDKVDMGQMIAKADGFVSVPCFSSVSGIVKEIAPRPHISGSQSMSIVIHNDFEDRLSPDITSKGSSETLASEDILGIIKNAGIVGMGGAAFPTHVKLSPPPENKIDTIIVNGAECEPFLTADHRIMLEYPREVIKGLKAAMKVLGVKKAYVAIEDNKRNAIAAISEAVRGQNINVATLKVKYPQGAEKQLIHAITKRQVPSGKLPMDIGVVVINAGTAYQIALAIEKGLPLFERVVTVTGSVSTPSNLVVRIGTPISHVIAHVGGLSGDIDKIIAGGPMMGITQHNLDAPVIKGTSGILALDKRIAHSMEESPCIRCGKCVGVCPIGLQPYLISAHAEKNNFEAAEKTGALDCIECGCCSYICPANRHLVQGIRLAKGEIANNHKKASI
ncbi:MAG: electron transport complex subunit RsxC [Christensenellales bacterium]|jgi:electron transport complex protein RnfC